MESMCPPRPRGRWPPDRLDDELVLLTNARQSFFFRNHVQKTGSVVGSDERAWSFMRLLGAGRQGCLPSKQISSSAPGLMDVTRRMWSAAPERQGTRVASITSPAPAVAQEQQSWSNTSHAARTMTRSALPRWKQNDATGCMFPYGILVKPHATEFQLRNVPIRACQHLQKKLQEISVYKLLWLNSSGRQQ